MLARLGEIVYAGSYANTSILKHHTTRNMHYSWIRRMTRSMLLLGTTWIPDSGYVSQSNDILTRLDYMIRSQRLQLSNCSQRGWNVSDLIDRFKSSNGCFQQLHVLKTLIVSYII